MFNIQERDLDLMILEELYSDSGFSAWLADRIGRTGASFVSAHHSVSAKVGAKWGETDVLAFFQLGNEKIAVMIEDKISAAFTDSQAERYHDRAIQIVSEGHAQSCQTVLIAPASYLSGVPPRDSWSHRIAIEEIKDWFGCIDSHHARWRHRILEACLYKPSVNKVKDVSDFRDFAINFSKFLNENHPEFSHSPSIKGDAWGLSVGYQPKIVNINIWWKVLQSRVDMSIEGNFVGRIEKMAKQEGVEMRLASDGKLKGDIMGIVVSAYDWSRLFSDQISVVNEVVAACQRLRSLAMEIVAS